MPRISKLILVLKNSPPGFQAIPYNQSSTFLIVIEAMKVYELTGVRIESQLIFFPNGPPLCFIRSPLKKHTPHYFLVKSPRGLMSSLRNN